MFVYVFPYISKLTDNYHSSGGLVVVANGGTDRVIELINLENQRDFPDDEYDEGPVGIAPTPDELDAAFVYRIAGEAPEGVFVFPDAGCC